MNTDKSDWLNDMLADGGGLVSSHSTFGERLGINGKVELRFIKFRNKFIYFLTIYMKTSDIVGFHISHDNDYLIKLMGLFKPLNILLYSDEEDKFTLHDIANKTNLTLSNSMLCSELAKYNPALVQDTGTIKAINKSVNDNFQIWTRTYLSKYAVVNDIDAIMFKTKPILLELKRVKENIETWLPYLDDISNYNSINAISKSIGAFPLTFGYNSDTFDKVSAHINITPYDRTHINGKKTLMTPSKRFINDSDDKLDWIGYKSFNKRK
jgi:hypothetical protein